MTPNETEYAQVDRESDLADSAFNHLAEAAAIANFNLTSVALFMLATTLANLQFHTGLSPVDALRKVEELVAAQVDVLAEENEPLAETADAGTFH